MGIEKQDERPREGLAHGADAQAGSPFVEVRGLSLKTPMGPVYENVTFKAGKGALCCVFGGQGSGKTSLMLTVCGRMKASRGHASVAGLDVRREFRKVRRLSGLSFIPGLNDVQSFLEVHRIVAAELALAGKRGNKATTDAYLEQWDFLGKKDVQFKDLTAYDTALLGIILALCGDPELLVVDDVQTDLTQHEGIKLMQHLRGIAAERSTTVLVGCTEYEIARQADSVVVMGPEAESQRRAVIRDRRVPLEQTTPIAGSGNGAEVDYRFAGAERA